MEEFDRKGLWWLPQYPDHRVAGTLKFDPVDGAVLETIGSDFTSQIGELFGKKHKVLQNATIIPENIVIDTICGNTDRGDLVTLCKCYPYGGNWASGYMSSKFRIETVFIGCHFEEDADIIFDSIAIRYMHLEEWLGLTGFSYDLALTPKGEYLDGEFKYVPPKRLEIRVNNLNIAFYHNLHVSGDMFFNIHANQSTFVEIIPDQPMSIDDYRHNVIHPLRNFLSLGCGRAIYPLVIKARNQNCTIDISTGESIPRDVYIFYAEHNSSTAAKKQLAPGDMLFCYPDIADNLQKYLQNWFDKAEKLSPVFDLYFGISYMPSMYVQLQFLTLAQALESYHRRKHGGVYMTVEKYESIQQKLIQAIPVDLDRSHRDSLKSRIKYGYEYSLRKRLDLILNDVLKPYKKIIDRLIGNRGEFIGTVVETRNYLTHYTEELEQTAITDLEEQYKHVQKMKLLIQLCFLVELGLPTRKVEELSGENRKFQFWLQNK